MAIKFKCGCENVLAVPDNWAGRSMRCAACGATILVPSVLPVSMANGPPAIPAQQEPNLPSDSDEFRRGYQPDQDKRRSVYWLAAMLSSISIFCAGPAFLFGTWNEGHPWPYIVTLVAMLQLGYLAWMSSGPDWSCVWIVMWVYGVSAALYAVVMAACMFSPDHVNVLRLDLYDFRRYATGWSAAVMLLDSMGAFMAGRMYHRWHKTYTTLYTSHS